MIKVGVTGSNGFIGWHLCRTLELDFNKFELVQFKRDWFNENINLDSFVSKCDILIHLAGLNRHSDERAIYDTNVDLVLYAFEHANQGDLFVQKAPSATVGTLAQALIELYKSSSEIKVIGTRHGEKLYETLVNREDMTKAENLGEYYRIPADNRDLNYEQYFSEGIPELGNLEEYHSHNTSIIDVEGMNK